MFYLDCASDLPIVREAGPQFHRRCPSPAWTSIRDSRRCHQAAWTKLDLVTEAVDSLILDFLEWIGPGERPYLETWRTSCPRPPVWEGATDLRFIERRDQPGGPALVSVWPAS